MSGKYNEEAVNKGLKTAGVKPNSAEGKAIHALLKGWRGNKPKSKQTTTRKKTTKSKPRRRVRATKAKPGLAGFELVP